MDILDQVFVVVSKDRKKIMKGLSKSERYLMDIDDYSKHVSTFTTKVSAEAWLRSGRILFDAYEKYDVSDLEVIEAEATYRCGA